MGCFSIEWLEQLFIYIIIVGAIIAIIRLLVPMVFAQWGGPGNVVAQVVNIILWAVIACFVVWICFALFGGLIGHGGFSLLPPHR
jgi:hypothetical protein